MALAFRVTQSGGGFADSAKDIQTRIAVAATLAVRDAGSNAQARGRADITAVGLGNRVAAALRVRFYPDKKKYSIDAAALVYSKVFYAGAWEDGATIRGNPRLWLPTSNVPTRQGQHRVTPAFYIRNIGRLISVNVPGHPPMLMGLVPRSKAGKLAKLSTSKRRKRTTFATQRATLVRVPMFIGIDQVHLRKRTNINPIINSERAKLAQYYVSHIETG